MQLNMFLTESARERHEARRLWRGFLGEIRVLSKLRHPCITTVRKNGFMFAAQSTNLQNVFSLTPMDERCELAYTTTEFMWHMRT
jgi:hypothetical protein